MNAVDKEIKRLKMMISQCDFTAVQIDREIQSGGAGEAAEVKEMKTRKKRYLKQKKLLEKQLAAITQN